MTVTRRLVTGNSDNGRSSAQVSGGFMPTLSSFLTDNILCSSLAHQIGQISLRPIFSGPGLVSADLTGNSCGGFQPPGGEETKSAREGSQRAGLMHEPGRRDWGRVRNAARAGEREGALQTSRK